MTIIALSVTEVELFSAVMCSQYMLFVVSILNEMVLKVKLLMMIDIEKKGAKYITNSWSVGRRLRHVEVK